MKNLIFIFLLLISNMLSAQIPDWYKTEMKRMLGTWVGDNSEYMNENETDDHYVIHWTYGLDKGYLKGKLYGMKEDARTGIYWEFVQFWDAKEGKVRVMQFNGHGMFLDGYLERKAENETELIQTMIYPNGKSSAEGHRSKIIDGKDHSTSYSIENGEWKKKRSYIWVRQ